MIVLAAALAAACAVCAAAAAAAPAPKTCAADGGILEAAAPSCALDWQGPAFFPSIPERILYEGPHSANPMAFHWWAAPQRRPRRPRRRRLLSPQACAAKRARTPLESQVASRETGGSTCTHHYAVLTRRYNASEVVGGRRMADWLRFAAAFWHFRADGSDMFGAPTRRWSFEDDPQGALMR